MYITHTGNVTDHINTRIQAARRAYYGLQSSGVCCDGVTPKTLSHIYKVGIQPILTYGCSAVNIDHKFVKCMDNVQGMRIKLHWDYRNIAGTHPSYLPLVLRR